MDVFNRWEPIQNSTESIHMTMLTVYCTYQPKHPNPYIFVSNMNSTFPALDISTISKRMCGGWEDMGSSFYLLLWIPYAIHKLGNPG